MSSPVEIAYCGEGPTDVAVARKLIVAAGAVPGIDYLSPRRGRGKAALDRRLEGFNLLAHRQPVLILRDLDHDAACAGALVAALAPRAEPGLLFRIAVRSVEAWLMADRAAFARAMGVVLSQVPREPEHIDNPKRTLADLLSASRDRSVRRRVGVDGPAGLQPQLVSAELSEFVATAWDPARAAASGSAPSLARAIGRLRRAAAA